MSDLAPHLSQFIHLRDLELEEFKIDQPGTHHWPRPSFKLTTLNITFEAETAEASSWREFEWLTYTSRDSLTKLKIDGPDPGTVAILAQWGANLTVLTLLLFCDLMAGAAKDEALGRLLPVIRLGAKPRLAGLEKLSIIMTVEEESKSACLEFGDEAQDETFKVNEERGGDAVDLWIDWLNDDYC